MEHNILETIDKETIGRRLQAARLKADYSLAETGLQTAHLAAIEQGIAQITPHEIITLAHLYGVQVADLVNPLPEGLSQEDILAMLERAEISEGAAAHYLGIDRLALCTIAEKSQGTLPETEKRLGQAGW